VAALNHFLTNQLVVTPPEISPLRITALENGEMDQAMMMGLTPLAWSPLGGGRLATPETAREKAVAEALDVVARDRGVSRAVAAYSWLMAHPSGIIPIIGSQNPARIAEGAAALSVQWSREEWREAAMSMEQQQCEIAWFSALCDDDYEFLGVHDPYLKSSWEHCRNIVMRAEEGG
ncbi:hypothetical protein KXV85_003258, partial [Aspergillus fumigatus]